MKTRIVLYLGALFCAVSLQGATFEVVTNRTPEIAVPSSWTYESQPGTFFWNGFYCGVIVVIGCWGLSIFRGVIGDNREEM